MFVLSNSYKIILKYVTIKTQFTGVVWILQDRVRMRGVGGGLSSYLQPYKEPG
jgi:hypothetical protein